MVVGKASAKAKAPPGAGGNAPDNCRTCRRSFRTTVNPIVKDARSTDLLKRRAPKAAQCRPCHNFMSKHTHWSKVSTADRYTALDEDAAYGKFFEELQAWEALRRNNTRRERNFRGEAQAVETSGLETRQVQGYLWPLPLLKQRGKDIPKRLQTIQHLGKSIKGVILPDVAVGAVEITTKSERLAQKVTVAAEQGSSGEEEADVVASGGRGL